MQTSQSQLNKVWPWGLTAALLVGLLHGLLYVFIVLPWQHYDEPNHFEYTWFIAQKSVLPKPGDYDPAMSRLVNDSMKANGFYGDKIVHPAPQPTPTPQPNENRASLVPGSQDLQVTPGVPEEKVKIPGFTQLGEPPLYYWLAAQPMRLVDPTNVEAQLYAGRLVSLALMLLTILAAWGVTVELTSPGSPLQWMVPLSLALLPGFVDIMTSLNHDVGATAFFAMFLWGSVRLIKRGFSLPGAAWVLVAAVLCYFTKNIVYIALPLTLLVLALSLVNEKRQRWVWAALALACLVALAFALTGGDAAGWYRGNLQATGTRFSSSQAVVGTHVLQIDLGARITPSWLAPVFEPLPLDVVDQLGGKDVTLGVWMWANRPVKVRLPAFSDTRHTHFEVVELTQEPHFYAFQTKLRDQAYRAWITIQPLASKKDIPNVVVYYDGLVLAKGARPVSEAPQFTDPNGQAGLWGGKPFINFIHNGSFETAGPHFRAWADTLGSLLLPDQVAPSLLLAYVLDWQETAWFQKASAMRLLRTFWAQFGWGHVALPGFTYKVLGVITLITLAAALWGLWRRRNKLLVSPTIFLGLVMLIVWGASLLRSPHYLSVARTYLPVARYALPAIIPTMLLLNLGWLELFTLLDRLLQRFWPLQKKPAAALQHQVLWGLYLAFFVVLDILSLVTIYNFYRA